MKIYYDDNVSLEILKDKTIAVIGYGIQGEAQAQCLRDSGLEVVLGLRDGPSWEKAEKDGMRVMSIEEAAKAGDIIMLLTPDMTQKKIYQEHIEKALKPGDALYFSHGLNITYDLIRPPHNVDVIMVAPKGPGAKLREEYLNGFGIPGLVAVHHDYSGKAKDKALALAKAMHLTKAGIFECTFDQETQSDLFGEQAVLCGGSAELIKAGFETLVENGYPSEIAYFEVLHELKLIVDLIQKGGIEYMWSRVSETARYGGRTKGKRVIDSRVKERMKDILNEIEDGSFTKEWVAEYESGLPLFEEMRRKESQHEIELVGKKIRSMFSISQPRLEPLKTAKTKAFIKKKK
ncbi:MAG: ketol-acid reductoisomerase [Candidatus Hydrothermarchaeota archaeon]|nr:ketol-acid reductoisomerase [Candidatus Hydrothermarchaeota archaeon]